MRLLAAEGRFAIVRLPAEAPIPAWADRAFVSITRTASELSLVVHEELVAGDGLVESGWRLLEVDGPLAFDEVGVLSSIAAPLADAGISIFVISTYDTDYLLVRERDLENAVTALRDAGHEIDPVPW